MIWNLLLTFSLCKMLYKAEALGADLERMYISGLSYWLSLTVFIHRFLYPTIHFSDRCLKPGNHSHTTIDGSACTREVNQFSVSGHIQQTGSVHLFLPEGTTDALLCLCRLLLSPPTSHTYMPVLSGPSPIPDYIWLVNVSGQLGSSGVLLL